MRIGIDATFLTPESLYTGMGVYTRGLIDGLRSQRNGHELVLLGYGPRPAAAPSELPWHSLPLIGFGRASLWLSHQLALPPTVRKLRLDALHVTGVNVRLSRPGIPLFCPCPLLVTVHDVIPLTYYGRQGPRLPWRLRLGYRLATLGIRRAAGVVAVSQTSGRDILEHLPVQARRLRVVQNGLDLQPPMTARAQTKALTRLGLVQPYVLYAGSFEPRKNLLGAVKAYRSALEARPDLPPLVLLVERDSGHRTAVMEAVERCGLGNRLRFLHSLADDELAAVYRSACLFIYPSFYEGFGFAPLQALAYGLPVISSNAGSLPEVLGNAARFVDPHSTASLAEAIVDLVAHPEAAAELVSRGRAQAARYSWEQAARLTLNAYEAATGQTKAESSL